jgi:hypothetical protein
MSYWAYTVLECTNPELISSGSTFVNESHSELLTIHNGKSHFSTWKNTMDDEIIELSKKHPEETFTAECHWANEYYDRIIYYFEYRNGKCKDLGIKPGYMFFLITGEIPNKEESSAFINHVCKYLERLDIVKKKDGGFIIDKLNDEEDKNGYESYFTITYENDLYKWTAEKRGISYIRVTVEKKEPKIYHLTEYEDKMKNSENEDSGDFPF